MPKIEVPEDRILDSLSELSPAAQKEALRRLLPSASYIEKAVEQNNPRIEAIASERGVDWNVITEMQRETLIDDLLHE